MIAVSYRLIGAQGRGLISSMDPAHAWVMEPGNRPQGARGAMRWAAWWNGGQELDHTFNRFSRRAKATASARVATPSRE